MKMILKSRQTTLRVTPITASADMTENSIILIGTMFSVGVPPRVQRKMGGEGRGGEGREGRGGEGKGRQGEASRMEGNEEEEEG